MDRNRISIYAKAAVFSLVEEHERSTGASISRILTAALLQYFLSDPKGPDPVWLRRAVMLAKGETSIEDIRKEMAP